MYKEFIVQELITGFQKYGEIKMFWINNNYSYAVNTIDRGPDNYKVKMIKDENILDECKKIGEKAINLVPPIIVNKKRVKPVMLRTDFTCCLNNDEDKKKYFLNEIEHQDAGSYVNFKSTTYPYVTVMADSFVKKAEELIKLGFLKFDLDKFDLNILNKIKIYNMLNMLVLLRILEYYGVEVDIIKKIIIEWDKICMKPQGNFLKTCLSELSVINFTNKWRNKVGL